MPELADAIMFEENAGLAFETACVDESHRRELVALAEVHFISYQDIHRWRLLRSQGSVVIVVDKHTGVRFSTTAQLSEHLVGIGLRKDGNEEERWREDCGLDLGGVE